MVVSCSSKKRPPFKKRKYTQHAPSNPAQQYADRRQRQQQQQAQFEISIPKAAAEQRAMALKVAAASLKYSIMMADTMQTHPNFSNTNSARSICSLLTSAAQALAPQLEQQPDTLTVADINPMTAFEDMTALAVNLTSVMAGPHAPSRLLPAQRLFDQLQQEGFAADVEGSMTALTPLLARLVCAAVPGSKVFVWLPPRLRAGMLAMELESRLVNESELFSTALGSTVGGTSNWDLQEPDDYDSWNERYSFTGATTTVGRCISISNGSQIILIATDDPATHVQRATRGMDPDAAWLAIAYDPQGNGSRFDPAAILKLSLETAADQRSWQRIVRGELSEEDAQLLPAKAQPCAVVLMF